MYLKSKSKKQSQQSRLNEMQKEIDELKSLLSQLVEKQSWYSEYKSINIT